MSLNFWGSHLNYFSSIWLLSGNLFIPIWVHIWLTITGIQKKICQLNLEIRESLIRKVFSKLQLLNYCCVTEFKNFEANGYEMGPRIYLLFWWRCKSSNNWRHECRWAKYSSPLNGSIELALFHQGYFNLGTNRSTTEKCWRIRKSFITVRESNLN